MLRYTVYSEAGGVGKTTLTTNLAAAHARAGLDVLAVPLDPQDGDMSHLLEVDDKRDDPDVDTLVHHLVERGQGPLTDIIRSVDGEGFDIIPEHNRLEGLGEVLQQEEDARGEFGESFPKWQQLQRVIREAGLADDYDVLIADPPASSGPALYNAIDATRNLVLPLEPTWKGKASVRGLDTLVENLSTQLGFEVGVLAAVPNRVKGTRDQEKMIEEAAEMGFDVPYAIRDRSSLLEGCWRQHCSAFTYMNQHRSRQRDYEVETLAKFDRLARHIEQVGGVDAPNPPEPGALAETSPEVA